MKCTTKQKNQLETRKTLIFSQVLSMAHASSMNNHGSATRGTSVVQMDVVTQMHDFKKSPTFDRIAISYNS